MVETTPGAGAPARGAHRCIAVLRPLPPKVLVSLTRLGHLIGGDLKAPARDDEVAELLAQADAAYITPSDKITAEVLAAAPGLKSISSVGAGMDHLDLAACAARGVEVSNTGDATAEPTADLAFGLILAVARRLPEAQAVVRGGDWARGTQAPSGLDIHHKTLGIVGLGKIGKAIARRARGFAMEVIYHNRRPIPAGEDAGLEGAWRMLPDLLQESDVVVLQLPFSPQARHIIGRAELARMKPTALLVNTGRGGLIDEDALVDALEAGALAGAALDVFENEPTLNPRLMTCRNLLLTPHIGTNTRASRDAMFHGAVTNLERMLEARR